MARLIIDPNIARPDDFYEALIDMHRDLTPAQSEAVNATLVLLLSNHIGDVDVLREAMGRARALAPAADAPLVQRNPA
ncbi:MAG: DUF2783 domain-containing protein [Burkholderiales bacterium]